MSNSDLRRVNDLRKIERGRMKKSHFILSNWITDSIKEEHIKNERHYEPKITTMI